MWVFKLDTQLEKKLKINLSVKIDSLYTKNKNIIPINPSLNCFLLHINQ